MTMSDTARATLERDITDALLRLRLARAQRNKKDTEVFGHRLDWLLDRWLSHVRVDKEMGIGGDQQ